MALGILVQHAPRHWTKYKYFDPYKVLPKLQKLRREVTASDLSDKVKSLRTHDLKDEREYWNAAVFCYLMSEASGHHISLCREQDSDYDSIFTWADGDSRAFAPVQLKELVPVELNRSSTLQEIFERLNKYTDSDDLIVGIKLNRHTEIDFDALRIPPLPVAKVWLFGATMENEKMWTLFGYKDEKWHRWDFGLPDA